MNFKKLFAGLMAVCLAVSLCACQSSTPVSNKDTTQAPNAQTTPTPIINATDEPTKEPESNLNKAEIDETEVYNADGVVIVAKSISESLLGTEVKLYVENNSEKNIAVSGDTFVINGITISDFLYIEASANKKANYTMTISASKLSDVGIEHIGYIDFVDVHIVDTDTFQTLNECPFRIETTLFNSFEQTIDDSGDVLYSDGGITVIAKKLKSSLLGETLILLVKNESGKEIIVQSDNASVNGFTITTLMSDYVKNGTIRFCEMTLTSSDLEENAIEQIDEIAFKLKFLDPKNFQTIAQTDELTVSTSN